MFRNYITTSLRNLQRYKWYSTLNIVGLALGLSCSALILFYVMFELGFDRYHSKSDRIYRVYQRETGRPFLGSDYFAVVPAPLGKNMESDFPEVESSVKISSASDAVVGIAGNSFFEGGIFYAEPALFKIFDFRLSKGDLNTALTEPFSVVLSQEIANKYFRNEDPIGKIIRYENKYDLKVTGILKDIPQNSHFIPKILISLSTYEAISDYKDEFTWQNSSFYTYILLRQKTNARDVEAKLPSFINKYQGKLFEEWGQKEPTQYFLQPLKDIHLHSTHINFDVGENNDTKSIYILTCLALIILFTACINYMNLSTARASLRAKEVGVRKVVGAQRFELVKQFFGESLTITSIAALLAVIFILVALPKFSELVQRNFSLSLISATPFVIGFVLVAAIVGIAAGIYPAFVLSSFKSVNIIKGTSQTFLRSRFRNVLVVIQFVAAVTLIISSVIVLKQLNFIRTGNMGYNRDQIVVLNLHDKSVQQKAELLKENLLRNPNIVGVTASSLLPIDINSQTEVSGFDENKNGLSIRSYQLYVDSDFLNVYKIPLIKGRNFSKDFSDENNSFIVNETFVKKIGWKQPIGKTIIRNNKEAKVIGVVKDFHMHSLHQQIAPLFIKLRTTDWAPYLSIRIRPDNIASSISYIKKSWSQLIKDNPIDFSFLDESFEKMYNREEKLSEIVFYFTFFAIAIASLGLLGLAAFITEQRKKEIGIRKVLGAKISEVALLLSREFLMLVLIANLIAFPIGYYFMNSWLKDFAYRIDISVWIFILSGSIAILIALATVSYHAVKTAMANPVESLRYE